MSPLSFNPPQPSSPNTTTTTSSEPSPPPYSLDCMSLPHSSTTSTTRSPYAPYTTSEPLPGPYSPNPSRPSIQEPLPSYPSPERSTFQNQNQEQEQRQPQTQPCTTFTYHPLPSNHQYQYQLYHDLHPSSLARKISLYPMHPYYNTPYPYNPPQWSDARYMGGGYGPAAGGSWPDFLEEGWNAAAPALGPAPDLGSGLALGSEEMEMDKEAHLTPHSPYGESSLPALGDCERGMDGKAEEGCAGAGEAEEGNAGAGAGAELDEGREIGCCESGFRMLVGILVLILVGAGVVICIVLVGRVVLALEGLLGGSGLWIQYVPVQ